MQLLGHIFRKFAEKEMTDEVGKFGWVDYKVEVYAIYSYSVRDFILWIWKLYVLITDAVSGLNYIGLEWLQREEI